MYKAKTIEEIFSRNKYTFSSNYHLIENWIDSLEENLSKALIKRHGYNRVVSLFDFHQLSQLVLIV